MARSTGRTHLAKAYDYVAESNRVPVELEAKVSRVGTGYEIEVEESWWYEDYHDINKRRYSADTLAELLATATEGERTEAVLKRLVPQLQAVVRNAIFEVYERCL